MGDDKRALLAAVAAAAAASAGGDGDEGAAERYESLLAYVKRHSSRFVWWRWFDRETAIWIASRSGWRLALIDGGRAGFGLTAVTEGHLQQELACVVVVLQTWCCSGFRAFGHHAGNTAQERCCTKTLRLLV